MSNRIVGHVDYSGCKPSNRPGPKRTYVKRAKGPDRAPAAEPEPHATPTDAAVLTWLRSYATNRQRAPQKHEIVRMWGYGGLTCLDRLIKAGAIVILVGNKNLRVMQFPPRNLETLKPEGFRAYRMVDAQGSWMWHSVRMRWVQLLLGKQ